MDTVVSCVIFRNRGRSVITDTRDTDNRSGGGTLRLDNCQPPIIIKRIYSTVSQNIVFCQRMEFSPEEPKSYCSVLYVRGGTLTHGALCASGPAGLYLPIDTV